MQNRKRDTDVQNRLLGSVGEGEGGMFQENSIETCILSRVTRSPAQVGCMRQVLGPGTLGRPREIGWRGRWEGGSGWGIHVYPRLIHVNVWQKPLQYRKVISLQLIKLNGKKKSALLKPFGESGALGAWAACLPAWSCIKPLISTCLASLCAEHTNLHSVTYILSIISNCYWLYYKWGFPGGACQCRRCKRCGFDPWVRKIPWSRKWQSTQYYYLENSIDKGAWQTIVWGHEESGTTEHASTITNRHLKSVHIINQDFGKSIF